jgi:glutamate-1-semialdehyde 2,1-aminomutase
MARIAVTMAGLLCHTGLGRSLQMTDGTRTNSKIINAYRQRTTTSGTLASRAREVLPSGIVHDSRHLDPYPIYVNRAEGARKWDVDGNEYVDYYGGHGALLLGHNDARVMEAAHRQMDLGTHYAACHELELRWAELVRQLVPSAERVRFTSSGTEANLIALRLARPYTGKSVLVRFKGHFDGTPTPGVLDGIAQNVLIAPPDDLEATRALLDSRDDIAAVILEPTGASFGWSPMSREFVAALRETTAERGIVLIFDEVVTGFRVSPGGAQAHYGITPDLTSLAKILAGGLPGGAVVGRREILDWLDFEQAEVNGREKIHHQGTFNANPVSAAAGIACLEIIADGEPCETATTQAQRLQSMINRVFADEDVPWAAFGEHSAVYFFTNPDGIDIDPLRFDATALDAECLRTGGKHPAAGKFRLALMLNGVDISGRPGGSTSCKHSDADLEHTAEAVRQAMVMLKEEGEL